MGSFKYVYSNGVCSQVLVWHGRSLVPQPTPPNSTSKYRVPKSEKRGHIYDFVRIVFVFFVLGMSQYSSWTGFIAGEWTHRMSKEKKISTSRTYARRPKPARRRAAHIADGLRYTKLAHQGAVNEAR